MEMRSTVLKRHGGELRRIARKRKGVEAQGEVCCVEKE